MVCRACDEPKTVECDGCGAEKCCHKKQPHPLTKIEGCAAYLCAATKLCEDCSKFAKIFVHTAAGTWAGCAHVKCGRVTAFIDCEDLLAFADSCPKCKALKVGWCSLATCKLTPG